MRDYLFYLKTLGLQGAKILYYSAQKDGKPISTGDSNVLINVAESDINTQNFVSRFDTADDAPLGWLGHPVWSNAILQSQDKSISINFDDIIIEVSQQKQIVKTAIQGRNGTFKEYIGDGDYQVYLKGIVNSNTMYQYPSDAVTELLSLCKIAKPIIIISEYLRLFKIFNVVIESYDFPIKKGISFLLSLAD